MDDADRPQPHENYQASSLVVSPRPNEFGFPLRKEEFQILCEGAVGDARASRDLSLGILVGGVVGLAGVFATTDWTAIWQPGKRGIFFFWVALLFLGVVASGTAAVIFHQRLQVTRADSAYARLRSTIAEWFAGVQTSDSDATSIESNWNASASAGQTAGWQNSGNLYWLGHDLMYSKQIALRGVRPEEVTRALRQACYHLDHVGLKENHVGRYLLDLRTSVEAASPTMWNDEFRKRLADKIESVIEQVGSLAAGNQKDFEADVSH